MTEKETRGSEIRPEESPDWTDVLMTEIPKTVIVRIGVTVLVALAFLFMYWIVSMTLSPRMSGETRGEAAMVRGAFFFTLGPIPVVMAFVAAAFTSWQKKHLTQPWQYFGYSPAFAILPAILYVGMFFGKT